MDLGVYNQRNKSLANGLEPKEIKYNKIKQKIDVVYRLRDDLFVLRRVLYLFELLFTLERC